MVFYEFVSFSFALSENLNNILSYFSGKSVSTMFLQTNSIERKYIIWMFKISID